MEILVADRIVATSHDFPTVNCSIDPEDMRYISSLLRNNYSNTILATIREVYANAADASKESGLSTESIQIKSPTFLDQTFFVRDFGAGLSRDQIFNLYSKFGKSTKRNSNSLIGGYGIGKFAPLSYKDSFTITSYHEGIKSIYSVYISEENDTKIDEIFCEPTLESNGICISVGVSSGDIAKFNQEISSFFSNFEIQPHFLNLQVEIAKPEIVASGTNWQIRKSNNHFYNQYSVGEQGIVMGGIYYPINPELVDFKLGEDYAWAKFLNKLVFIADIGSVSLHHSRESLEYNKTTKAYLKSRYQSFCNEFVASIKNKIAQFNCLREVMAHYKQVKDTFPRSAFDQLEEQNVFVYQGYKVQNHTFNRSHYQSNGENKRIPVYAKLYTLGSGNRVSISKCYTLVNSPDVYIVFNDMPDNTKIVPRIYGLLSNKKATEVVVVSHDNAITSSTIVNGVNKFKEVNRFDLIKSGYCNLSELAPVKLPSTKKSSTSVALPANSFYSVSGGKIGTFIDQTVLNDNNIVKLFLPVSDRKTVGYYECLNHRERGYLNNRFLESFQTKFEMSIFGVSNNIATSKKFESRTDFIDFRTYFQDKWNNLSDEVKGLIFEYVSCLNSEYYKITDFFKILQNVSIYREFYVKKTDIKEKLTNLNELDFADFVFNWWPTLNALKIHISFNNKNLQDVVGVYLKSVEDSIYNDYPMLKLHGKLHGYGNGENDEDFKSYIDLVNSKKSVDISKI